MRLRRGIAFWVGGSASLLLVACGPRTERAAPAPSTSAPPPATASAPAPAKVARTGEEIYQEYCSVCHMADGSGVPNFQPALRGSPIVAGDPAKLEAVVRAGSAALSDREPMFAAEMPPFGNLSDEEVHAIVAYVRERFGPNGAAQQPAP